MTCAFLIDDDQDARTLAARALRQAFAGIDIVEISDAASLEKGLAAAAPDVAVLDLDLRWSTGLEVYRRIHERYPYAAAIMYTGSGNEETAVEAIRQGFDDYVVKRRDRFMRLVTSVETSLKRRAQLKQLHVVSNDLVAAIEDRDVLLQELYHRLSNSLQLIVALNTLAAQRLDPAARGIIDDINERIQALALLQERLYRTRNVSRVEFASHLADLTKSIAAVQPQRIRIDFCDDPVTLPVSIAIPLTLIVNELVMNAVKHAFPDGRRGTIAVALSTDEKTLKLSIKDDGVGTKRDYTRAGGMGMHLIRRLAAQIKADIAFLDAAIGTHVQLTTMVPE